MLVDYWDSSEMYWKGVTDLRLKSRLIRRLEQILGRKLVEITCSRPAVVHNDTDNRPLNTQATRIVAVFQGIGTVLG